MIKSEIVAKWYPHKKEKVLNVSDKIMYTIARQTLDRTLPHIPFKSGNMRRTSMSAGVRGSNGDYFVGSYTNYAKYVWVMPKKTKWSEPNTFGKWYKEVYMKQYKNIESIAIKENELK